MSRVTAILFAVCISLFVSLQIVTAYTYSSSYRCLSTSSQFINSINRQVVVFAEKSKPSTWDPKTIPKPKAEFLQQKMDASWGRGKFREEVWNDKANPSNDWWEAYAPSEEEIEAAEAGYDFSNPKDWFESQGLNFEEVEAMYLKEQEQLLEQLATKERPKFSMKDFDKAQEIYFKLQKEAFELAFRADDNMNQESKGQPSLDVEDTGAQYLLEKEDA